MDRLEEMTKAHMTSSSWHKKKQVYLLMT